MDAESQLLAAKDAEIERLKEENAHFAWRDKDKNRLITELCDALEEEYGSNLGDGHPSNLLQRGREATRQLPL